MNRYARVTLDTCVYSVPWQYAYKQATVKAYVNRVEAWVDHQRVAEHVHCYERNQSILALDHYLEVFLTKPGALQFAIPFKRAILPEAYHTLHQALRWGDPRGGDKEFIRVLMLLRKYSQADVLWAVEEALRRGVHYADAVRSLLVMRHSTHETPQSLNPKKFAHVPAVVVPPARTDHFSRLLPKGGVIH